MPPSHFWNPTGVVVGAVLRVFVASGSSVFRVLAAALLLPIGLWQLLKRPERSSQRMLTPRRITQLALAVGVVGGIYGIGGGSILGPILVGAGMPLATVAPPRWQARSSRRSPVLSPTACWR
jgi:hypothetical protein